MFFLSVAWWNPCIFYPTFSVGNAGGVCVAGACSIGHCQKLDHSISGGHQCYKNRECARICPGNGDDCDGICTNNNHGVSAGRCARPAGSLHARSLPNNLVEIDECTRNIGKPTQCFVDPNCF